VERTVQKRLIVGQAAILLVLAAAVTTAILALRSMEQHTAQATEIHARLAHLNQLRADARELARSARRYVLTRDPQDRQRVFAIETRVDKDRELLRDGTTRESARELEHGLDAYVSVVIRAMSESADNLAPTLARFEDDLVRARSSVGSAFDELILHERSRLHSAESSRRLVRGARWALLIAGALGGLLVVGVTFSVTRLVAGHRARTRRTEADAERVAAARKELLAAGDELRVPLEAILSRCALLQAMKLRGGADQELETIATSARVVARMLDALLDVTAIRTGSVSLGREPCDASSLVDRAIKHHRDAALARGIRLRSEAQLGTSVCADPERVGHVLVTLLGGAIAAARVGADVVISATPSRDSVRFAIINVSPALPAPLDQLYPPAAVAPSDELDLLRCKRVIEAHGGTMGIEAAAAGRTSWFTLPTEPSLLR